jgi:hypothetical protein
MGSSGSRPGPTTGTCECGNEFPVSLKCWEFFECLRNCWFVKKGSGLCSKLVTTCTEGCGKYLAQFVFYVSGLNRSPVQQIPCGSNIPPESKLSLCLPRCRSIHDVAYMYIIPLPRFCLLRCHFRACTASKRVMIKER